MYLLVFCFLRMQVAKKRNNLLLKIAQKFLKKILKSAEFARCFTLKYLGFTNNLKFDLRFISQKFFDFSC